MINKPNFKQVEALIEIANEVAAHGDCHCVGDGEPCVFCFANSTLDEIENAGHPSDCEVFHEEIITHPAVNQEGAQWRGEARVIVAMKINGQTYECKQVVSLLFTNQSEMEDFKRVASWMTGDSGDSELVSLVKESLGARICLCKSQGTCWHCRARVALNKTGIQ